MADNKLQLTDDYKNWLSELKIRIKHAQQKAVLAVNKELVLLYWQIGHEILIRQERSGWGAKIVNQLSADLKTAFPEMQGFSPRNLKYMRAFAAAWQDFQIVQEVLAQLPWYHHLTLLDKLSNNDDRMVYARLAVENGWSRNMMVHHIELGTAKRIGKAQNNFADFLPPAESELAAESLKDPYKFDFITLSEKAQEKDLKKAADTGDGFAMCNLGSRYLLGKGVERDEKLAIQLLKKSAEQQDTPSAFYVLYMCYTDGRGVRKNRRLALENLRKSAELGYPKARKVLKKLESGK